MHKKVNPIPEGYHTITPFLSFKDPLAAITFYKNAFGAEEIECHRTDTGLIMHAVIKVGDSLVMIAQFPEHSCGISPPQEIKATTALFHMYVENADAIFDSAVAAGAKVQMPLTDMFWGDRYGQIVDPFGHTWSIATRINEPSAQEIEVGIKEWE